ncbi:MAG: proton-conducting transporter membrane subunit [Cryomorphaceae bacterium]
MSSQLIIWPIFFPLVLAVALMFFWTNVKVQRIISVVGSIVSVGVAVALFAYVNEQGSAALQGGNWPAPFGITFVADTLSSTLVLLAAISGLAVSLFSVVSVEGARLRFGYFPVFHVLLMGLNGAFLTGDLFNLYVWFEVIIISSFVLITLGGERKQLEGAVKYFTLNMLASIIFLTAIAVIYGLTGSLNLADISLQIAKIENRFLVEIAAVLFFVGFGIKSAVFPLYFWLPASYHTPPDAVSAIFGGLLTKVGVYAYIRVFTLIFPDDAFIRELLVSAAVLTIFSGALGAFFQNNLRKVFSYLIVCHIGFMIAGLGLGTELAFAGMIFYLIHDIVVKTNLFLVSGLVYRLTGSVSLRDIGGIYARYPWIAFLISIPLFSLVGIPPLSGFWPKISLFGASLETSSYWVLGAYIFGSVITLYIIAKVWAAAVWKDSSVDTDKVDIVLFNQLATRRRVLYIVPVVLLSVVSLYIGLGAEYVQGISERIALDLIDTRAYVETVLGPVQNLQP